MYCLNIIFQDLDKLFANLRKPGMSGRVDGGPGLLRDLGLRGPRQGQILVRDHPPPHEALLVLVPLLFAPFLLLQR